MKTKTRDGTALAPERRRSNRQPQTTTTPREVRYFWPLVIVIAAATGVLLVWAGLQTTSVVDGDTAFSGHDSGIEMALREQEVARNAAIGSAHDSGIATQVQGRDRDLLSVHDSGIARQLQLQGEREALSAAYDSGIAAQVRLRENELAAAVASAHDSGIAAQVRLHGEHETAVASAHDSGLAAAVKAHAGGTEVLSSECPPTPSNAGGWEVQYFRAGC